jgi:hypothetical protein
MRLTILGVCFGWVFGFTSGFAVEYFGYDLWQKGVSLGVLTACIAAVAGAIVGGVADVLAFLRAAFPDHEKWPEADYSELPTFPGRRQKK